jgi:hypothetical protein
MTFDLSPVFDQRELFFESIDKSADRILDKREDLPGRICWPSPVCGNIPFWSGYNGCLRGERRVNGMPASRRI